MSTRFVNMTPHPVRYQFEDGTRVEFPASGQEARVDSIPGVETMICVGDQTFKVRSAAVMTDIYVGHKDFEEKKAFPPQQGEIVFIVSILVLQHAEMLGRTDVLSPGTGPKDGAVRFAEGPQKGQVDAVTTWISAPAE